MEDICVTSFTSSEANVGCPYVFSYGTQVQYQNTRIINGQIVPQIEHPWMVQLRFYSRLKHKFDRNNLHRVVNGFDFSKKVYYCGGSIASETKIITAKHCVADNFDSGSALYSTPTEVSEVDFTFENVETLESCDAAVITLPKSVAFSRYAMPIKFPDPEDVPELDEWAMASGWGAFCDRQIDPFCSQLDENPLSLDNLR